jgi:hypothetical protein
MSLHKMLGPRLNSRYCLGMFVHLLLLVFTLDSIDADPHVVCCMSPAIVTRVTVELVTELLVYQFSKLVQ